MRKRTEAALGLIQMGAGRWFQRQLEAFYGENAEFFRDPEAFVVIRATKDDLKLRSIIELL